MTKEEMLKMLKENALNVKNADDTIENIKTKVVTDVQKAEGVTGLDSELPTQKAVEKYVNEDEGPIVPADKDGVSKDGGDANLMEPGKIEAERKKEDNSMKDVINVSSRKVEESAEVNNELLSQLHEAAIREQQYKAKIAKINGLCEKALKTQAEALTKEHAKEVCGIFESIIKEGEKFEKELKENAAKNKKLYSTAKKLYEGSNKLNKILLEAVKKAQPEKKMTRYSTPAYRVAMSSK